MKDLSFRVTEQTSSLQYVTDVRREKMYLPWPLKRSHGQSLIACLHCLTVNGLHLCGRVSICFKLIILNVALFPSHTWKSDSEGPTDHEGHK